VTQHDRVDGDLFSGHAYLVSRFGDKVTLSIAYMFTTLDSEIGGSRIYGNSYDPVFDPIYARRQQREQDQRRHGQDDGRNAKSARHQCRG